MTSGSHARVLVFFWCFFAFGVFCAFWGCFLFVFRAVARNFFLVIFPTKPRKAGISALSTLRYEESWGMSVIDNNNLATCDGKIIKNGKSVLTAMSMLADRDSDKEWICVVRLHFAVRRVKQERKTQANKYSRRRRPPSPPAPWSTPRRGRLPRVGGGRPCRRRRRRRHRRRRSRDRA